MKEKSKYGMPPPTTREDMEHNVYMLVDEMLQNMDDERFITNRLWAFGDSIEHLRHLPNGRIELPTIDERVRNLSNLMGWMKYLPPMTIEGKETE